MVSLIENISVTAFMSPHLFWIIEGTNEDRTKTLSKIWNEFENFVTNDVESDSLFELGQVIYYFLYTIH